jgi:hypothetical protein
MIRPYIITTHNLDNSFTELKAKFKLEKPLAFLDKITIGLSNSGEGRLASNITSFEITPKIEFLLVDDSVIGKINTALTDFGFEVTITDVTEDLLHNKIDYSNASEFTKYCIDKYYVDNFDVNDILDKINSVGIEKLTVIDKSIINKKP